ncbi:MAG TPA: cytochrome c oxidase assembly protein [Hyphomonadaceae bacterium]|nr:cytochrome c oxidase assembly protein [Hyphomonadaceae bacterium]
MNKGAKRTAWILGVVAVGMLALSFAAEPLYSTFCRLTGFNGTVQVTKAASRQVLDRVVRVRFDANVEPGMPLKFEPLQPYMDVKIGETVMAFYQATNTSQTPLRAAAAYNVAPHKVGQYFNKLECFCFKERTYMPGKPEKLPVVFYVSADMAKDWQDDDIKGVTLSYTYYRAGSAKPGARLEDASAVE